MNELAIRQPSPQRPWPMTNEAWLTLVDEVGRLRAERAGSAAPSVRDDGLVHLQAFNAVRRLDLLSAVLDASERVDEADLAVIGRRVTVLEDEGDSVTYELALPGEGDPDRGSVSADSPLGAALLGCTASASVEVDAPLGRRRVTVLSIE
ncbi:MAG: GreA/GreB family elongation factor [Chloroflexota bacterium]